MRSFALLVQAFLGDAILFSIRKVVERGLGSVLSGLPELTGLNMPSLALLEPYDRAPAVPVVLFVVGVAFNLVAWGEETLREFLLGGLVLTVFLMFMMG